MKKVVFTFIMFLILATAHSQDKGSHIFFGGGIGMQKFNYHLSSVDITDNVGYNLGLEYQYYFNYNWGIGIGLSFFHYNTQSYTGNKNFEYRKQLDDYGDYYDLRLNVSNWREVQKSNFLEIPIMLLWQRKFDRKEVFGMYFGVGVNVQIPVKNSYEVQYGTLVAKAYYEDFNIEFGSIDLPEQGLGSNNALRPTGKNQFRLGLGLTGRLGFLIAMGPRIDLMLGVSAEYGLFNIKRTSVNLVSPKEGAIQQDGSYMGENIVYNGMMNSSDVHKINPVTFTGNVGVKIKLGKLKERSSMEEVEKKYERVYERVPSGGDTIIINPVIIQVPVPVDGGGSGNSTSGRRGNVMYGGEGTNREMVIINTPDDNGRGRANRNSGGNRNNGASGSANGRGTSDRNYDYPVGVVEDLESSIYFDLNKYNLDAYAIETLERKIELMKHHPNSSLSLVGHTCNLGQETLNYQLSFKRAEEARDYMIRRGISPSRITIIPMGERYPTYPNTSESNRMLNRRVDFIISD